MNAPFINDDPWGGMTMTATKAATRRARLCAPFTGLFAACAALLLAGPAPAGSPAPDSLALLPAEFHDYAEDRTLIYRDRSGTAIGAERHLPGNRVIWSDPDGRCVQGIWRAEAGKACFYYADEPLTPVCWSMEHRSEGMVARLVDAGAQLELLVEASDYPLQCDVKDPAV